jgi:hypothetical protein
VLPFECEKGCHLAATPENPDRRLSIARRYGLNCTNPKGSGPIATVPGLGNESIPGEAIEGQWAELLEPMTAFDESPPMLFFQSASVRCQGFNINASQC